LSAGVYLDARHQGEVNHHRIVGNRLAGDAVTASANADGKLMIPRDSDRLHDVSDTRGPDDHGGFAIDHAVPNTASYIIFRISAGQHLALQLCA
jgi:hypothetical protein